MTGAENESKKEIPIIEKFNCRDEEALRLFTALYGPLCKKIAADITGNAGTADECFNDLLFKLWNSIPPVQPDSLKSYACRIIRNLALHEVEKQNAEKRSAIIIELEECCDIAADTDEGTITELINSFLHSQPKIYAYIFIRRYFYAEPVKAIAELTGYKENKVSKILAKLRKELKKALAEGGIRI